VKGGVSLSNYPQYDGRLFKVLQKYDWNQPIGSDAPPQSSQGPLRWGIFNWYLVAGVLTDWLGEGDAPGASVFPRSSPARQGMSQASARGVAGAQPATIPAMGY